MSVVCFLFLFIKGALKYYLLEMIETSSDQVDVSVYCIVTKKGMHCDIGGKKEP